MLVYLFDWHTRELYKFIRPLMYQKIIDEVIKENYVSSYTLKDKKIEKKELKKITFISEKEDKLKEIIEKNSKFRSFN